MVVKIVVKNVKSGNSCLIWQTWKIIQKCKTIFDKSGKHCLICCSFQICQKLSTYQNLLNVSKLSALSNLSKSWNIAKIVKNIIFKKCKLSPICQEPYLTRFSLYLSCCIIWALRSRVKFTSYSYYIFLTQFSEKRKLRWTWTEELSYFRWQFVQQFSCFSHITSEMKPALLNKKKSIQISWTNLLMSLLKL